MLDVKADWLGQEYKVGDYVVYPALMYRSSKTVTMTLAQVAKINDSGTVGVWPVKNSREKSYGRTWNIDTRSGEKIDIFEGYGKAIKGDDPFLRSMPHCRRLMGWYLKSDDSYVTNNQINNVGRNNCYYLDHNEFEPWVGKEHEETIVTLKVTQNITKWNGEIPDEQAS